MLRVTDIDYLGDYRLSIEFSDGIRKTVDLKPYLTGEVFEELLDKSKFIQYGLTPVTIEWANGADLAPEFLYEIGIEEKNFQLPDHIDMVAEPAPSYLKKKRLKRNPFIIIVGFTIYY